MVNRKSHEERFFDKIVMCPTSGCWLWTGYTNNGYGHFNVNGKTVGSHRYSYELKHGEIPTGLVVDHKCRNRSCQNPDHLRTCTQYENTMDAQSMAPPRIQFDQKCCPKCGGDYSPKSGGRGRYCRPCKMSYDRKRNRRKVRS